MKQRQYSKKFKKQTQPQSQSTVSKIGLAIQSSEQIFTALITILEELDMATKSLEVIKQRDEFASALIKDSIYKDEHGTKMCRYCYQPMDAHRDNCIYLKASRCVPIAGT